MTNKIADPLVPPALRGQLLRSQIKRRLLLLLAVMCAASASQAATFNVRPDSRIEIVYLTARDCPYCRFWRYNPEGDWARFLQTEAGREVQLVNADKGSLHNAVKRENYPAGYEHLYDRKPQFGKHLPSWWGDLGFGANRSGLNLG